MNRCCFCGPRLPAAGALAVCLLGFLMPGAARAQLKPQSGPLSAAAGYDARRETVVQGTVVSFTTDSVTPPIGTHVLVQTAAGTLDVHLGSSKVLSATKLTLNPGDSIRMVGEEMKLPNDGSVFAARILQKGAQSITLRNAKGVLIRPIPHDPQSLAALRGVR